MPPVELRTIPQSFCALRAQRSGLGRKPGAAVQTPDDSPSQFTEAVRRQPWRLRIGAARPAAGCSPAVVRQALQANAVLCAFASLAQSGKSNCRLRVGHALALQQVPAPDQASVERRRQPKMRPNPSLERTSTGMALGPRSSPGYRSASRAKRHPGSGPLSSNVRPHEPPPLDRLVPSKYRLRLVGGVGRCCVVVSRLALLADRGLALCASMELRANRPLHTHLLVRSHSLVCRWPVCSRGPSTVLVVKQLTNSVSTSSFWLVLRAHFGPTSSSREQLPYLGNATPLEARH